MESNGYFIIACFAVFSIGSFILAYKADEAMIRNATTQLNSHKCWVEKVTGNPFERKPTGATVIAVKNGFVQFVVANNNKRDTISMSCVEFAGKYVPCEKEVGK